MNSQNKLEQITLGGGCFWCIEAAFKMLNGVEKVVPGYSGGTTINPTYKKVCEGNTGHAEVAQISFNPDKISLIEIFEAFFKVHDPTSVNRQGMDVGTQYRSIIFYHNDEQFQIAQKIIDDLNKLQIYNEPIVTQLEKFETFYPAEDYHHNYYENNRNEAYCQFTIMPKLEKFKKYFEAKLK